MMPLTKLVRSVGRGFWGGEDGADCGLGQLPVGHAMLHAERFRRLRDINIFKKQFNRQWVRVNALDGVLH